MGKLYDLHEKAEIVFPWKYRFILIGFLVLFIGIGVLNSYFADQNKNTGDTNVYLNEEACFADEIYISVQSLNVTTSEDINQTDDDGDALSEYTLNLGL